MKKLIFGMTIAIYLIVFFSTFMNYKQNEYAKDLLDQYKSTTVLGWNAEKTAAEKNLEIQSYAQMHEINIYKMYYDVNRDCQVIFCAIGNKNQFLDDVEIMNKSIILSDNWCIANRDKGEEKFSHFYKGNFFFNDNLLEYRPITSDTSGITGSYKVTSGEESFFMQMGFKVADDNTYASIDIGTENFLIIVLLGLLVVIYFISYIYYSISKQREVSICRLMGWTPGSILLHKFCLDICKINILAFLVADIVAGGVLLVYNSASKFWVFLHRLLPVQILVFSNFALYQ
jgi:hypothetical protein